MIVSISANFHDIHQPFGKLVIGLIVLLDLHRNQIAAFGKALAFVVVFLFSDLPFQPEIHQTIQLGFGIG
ncbi:MAG: hypothetical protein ACK52W_01225 [Alphaproteobacteria bacterium]